MQLKFPISNCLTVLPSAKVIAAQHIERKVVVLGAESADIYLFHDCKKNKTFHPLLVSRSSFHVVLALYWYW